MTPCRTDVPEPDGPEERDGPHGPDPTHPKIPTHSMDPTMDPTDPDACNRHRTRVVSVAVRDDVVRDDVGDAARLSTRRSEKLPPLPSTGALCVAFIPPAFENLAITPQEPIE